MKKILLFLYFPFLSFSQIPAGYYDNVNGLSGFELKTALHEIIYPKTFNYNYGELGNFYPQTDADKYFENDNSVLDIYSEKPEGPDAYVYNFTQNIGLANAEGLGWNKEHMMPQSTYYSDYPMYSDLFYIVPTDARINQLRNNYPYGKAGTPYLHTFTNGSKMGRNISPNATYTGTVFEPIDEFKGDIARALLYFAVRYEGILSGFKKETSTDPTKDRSPLDGSEEQVYEKWFLDLLRSWNLQDPVSQKELDRNNSIYSIQKNRNPFIDHPEWIDLIWNQSASSVIPQNPTNLKATKVSAYFVNLEWDIPSDPNVLGYKIYRDGNYVSYTKTNSYTVDHLFSNYNYNFVVKSYNNAQQLSVESNILPVTTYSSDSYSKDLYITKYLEGTDDNKAIEIINKTGHTVNLNAYNLSIQFYNDPNYYFANSMQLEGEIENNESFLLINPRANFSCFNTSDAKFVTSAPQLTFSGFSYLSLGYKSTTIDAVGVINSNNFSELSDVSLYRSATISQPSASYMSSQWIRKPADFCANIDVLSTSDLQQSLDKYTVFPNPINGDKLFVNAEDLTKIKSAKLFDFSGTLILSELNPFLNKKYINISKLIKGNYLLKLDDQILKIIKQ